MKTIFTHNFNNDKKVDCLVVIFEYLNCHFQVSSDEKRA
jgi:hypothetical protein